MKFTLQCECQACKGTGLRALWQENKGTAAVCMECAGTGATLITLSPFTGRKKRSGIKTVVFECDGIKVLESLSMTVDAFEKKVKPVAPQMRHLLTQVEGTALF